MNKNTKINMPRQAAYIIDTITAAGYEAYIVGGCVRDSVLGRDPHDWDITTSAQPAQVKALFPRTIDTGLQHGTVTVMIDKEGYEVTTYRIDGVYEDGRHPREVVFTASLEEDLKRRDFTINAMAYNDETGLVDIFGGLEDMEAGVIRCVGNAVERFGEDALRMMRAVRFSAQLGYTVDPDTAEAIRRLAPTLGKVSAERIREELTKMLTSPHPDKLRDAYELGLTKVFLPELDLCMITEQRNPHHCYTVGEHLLHSMTFVDPDPILRTAMLLHDIAKPLVMTVDEKGVGHFRGHAERSADMARAIMRRLKFDNHSIAEAERLIRNHDDSISGGEPDIRTVRRAVSRIGESAFPALFDVRYADISAQSDYMRAEKLDRIEQWRALYAQILEKNQCLSLKELAVSGGDLIAAGRQPGAELGRILNALLDMVLEDPELNDRDTLLALAEKM